VGLGRSSLDEGFRGLRDQVVGVVAEVDARLRIEAEGYGTVREGSLFAALSWPESWLTTA